MVIGRLKEKYRRATQHYAVRVEHNEANGKALAIHWERKAKAQTHATHPGVYCLRTNLSEWDETTLYHADRSAVFRCLKSELGLRQNYHQKATRIEGHLFITLLAYHFAFLGFLFRRLRSRQGRWMPL